MPCKKSKDLGRSQGRNVHPSQHREPGSNSQVVTWPDMEALYLWGCWHKLRYMQL